MERFLPLEIATKTGLSLALGLLIGLERERSHKGLGVRTFTIASLLGTLSFLTGTPFSLIAMIGILLVIAFVNARRLLDGTLETTTSIALVATFILGVLIAQGHFFTPIASAVLLTMLLDWKAELRHFAGGLSQRELRSAILLGLFAFVVYPLLPNRFIDPFRLINPRDVWITVILVATIGFANYVLLRVYRTKGLYYSAILGGFLNSTATVAELTSFLSSERALLQPMTIPVVLLTVMAMTTRNLVILGVLAPKVAVSVLWPLGSIIVLAGCFAWSWRRTVDGQSLELTLGSPIALAKVFGFALLFLAIRTAGVLAQTFLGRFGILIVSFAGGLASSASATAATASMSVSAHLPDSAASAAAVAATLASIFVNVPILHRQTDQATRRSLYLINAVLFFTPIAVLLFLHA